MIRKISHMFSTLPFPMQSNRPALLGRISSNLIAKHKFLRFFPLMAKAFGETLLFDFEAWCDADVESAEEISLSCELGTRDLGVGIFNNPKIRIAKDRTKYKSLKLESSKTLYFDASIILDIESNRLIVCSRPGILPDIALWLYMKRTLRFVERMLQKTLFLEWRHMVEDEYMMVIFLSHHTRHSRSG